MVDKSDAIKRSAELLKQGATMLSLQCPKCGSPLFKIRTGEIVCPIHGRVHVISDESELIEEVSKDILSELEEKVVNKLRTMSNEIGTGRNPREEADYAEAFLNWLNVLEKIRNLKKREKEKP